VHIHLAARGLPKVKKVLSYHGFIPDAKNRITLRHLTPRMDANLVVSEGLRTWLHEKDGLDTSKLQVLYNGVDPSRLTPSGGSVRAEFGIPHDAEVAGMVGNFYRDPRKDQLTIVKALPLVLAKFPNLHFVFAGRVEPGAEGKLAECRETCTRAGIADRVHFLGARTDVPDILAALDLFVISSLQEGLPIALNEAMLAGVPVLASDIDPHVEASKNGRYAVLFRTGDRDDLAKEMIDLLSDPARRERIAADAKEYAIETFSIDAHLKRLVSIYRSLLDGEGAR
jgi:glycosyltransferase involved in cell wall biosynthesis